MNLLDIDPHWLWLIGGVVLLIAEVIAPGFFLIFIGVAAIATGLVSLALGLDVVLQLALFAVFAFAAVQIGGRRFYARSREPSSDPLLNDRAARLIGRTVVVVGAVDQDGGRVRVDDSEWTARGGPAEAGARVRIVGVDGNCLEVEAEDPRPSA